MRISLCLSQNVKFITVSCAFNMNNIYAYIHMHMIHVHDIFSYIYAAAWMYSSKSVLNIPFDRLFEKIKSLLLLEKLVQERRLN